ncbi:hypothetical protein C8D77_1358 [Mesorhizobium loti]|uniref:Uncharacterized protein n=1 Tax=Rhizobium loti TaxID=381 RepID=A0A8E2W7M0_RHILI|nr:hypothetical protein [Mesorhizobium loti]PWJ84346.1 hypothetical protein C8D77_1358 [Mesorhizobium loti]
MDFIERTFGVSPDGGDGTTEMLYIAVALVVGAMVVARWWLQRAAARRR